MSVEMKRITAVKTDINSLSGGQIIKQDGFNPSYMLDSNGQRLSRVRVLATVVDKFVSEDGKYASVTIDDGTGIIRAKSFKAIAIFNNVSKGDIVDMIGRIRSYNEETYIMPEIIYKPIDPNFLSLRKAELVERQKILGERKRIILESKEKSSDFDELKKMVKKKYDIEPEEVEAVLMREEMPKSAEEKDTSGENEKESVIKLIESMDSGNGCEYSVLIKESGMPEQRIENVINELLSDGVCFEPRPGVIKLL